MSLIMKKLKTKLYFPTFHTVLQARYTINNFITVEQVSSFCLRGVTVTAGFICRDQGFLSAA